MTDEVLVIAFLCGVLIGAAAVLILALLAAERKQRRDKEADRRRFIRDLQK